MTQLVHIISVLLVLAMSAMAGAAGHGRSVYANAHARIVRDRTECWNVEPERHCGDHAATDGDTGRHRHKYRPPIARHTATRHRPRTRHPIRHEIVE